MFFKVHKRGKSTLVSVCSEDILGKKFEEEDQILDVNEHFFGGEKMPLKELKKILESFENITLAGNEIVEEAIKLKFIDEDNIKTVQGVKWAICLNE